MQRQLLLIASAALFTLMAGCAVGTDLDDDGSMGEVTQSLKSATWRVDKVKALGFGSKFADKDGDPADAFIVANGNDLSIVFTKLGEATRVGPAGKAEFSRCALTVPLEVPAGTYLSSFQQTFQYGIVKPAGLRAGLSIDSRIRGAKAGQFDLPDYEVKFDKDSVLDSPLEVAASSREFFPETKPRYQFWKKRWCNRTRDTKLEYAATTTTWAQRDKGGLTVKIAVDGLDAHVDMGATLTDCPANP
jgi:hypothetical protein